MKKIYILLFSITFVMLLNNKAYAYTASNGIDYEYMIETVDTSDATGKNYKIYSHYDFCLCEMNKQSSKYKLLTAYSMNGQTFLTEIDLIANSHYTNLRDNIGNYNSQQSSGLVFVDALDDSTPTYSWTVVVNSSNYPNLQIFQQKQLALDYLTTPQVDFDQVYYSPLIPTPDIKVDYTQITVPNTLNNYDYDVPLSVYLPASDAQNYNNYFIEMKIQFVPVRTVGVSFDKFGGFTFSNASSRGGYYTYDLLKNSDLIIYGSDSSTSSDSIRALMVNKWTNFLQTEVPENSVNYVFYQNISTDLENSAKFRYQQVRRYQCMFGNYMRIWCRFFTIDSNNRYVVGAWRQWECYDSSAMPFDDTLPDYYTPYSTAVGNISTYTDTDADTNQNIPVGAGSSTNVYNPNNNVNVVTNVPNYPDYPTISSYNHDNLLVQFLNTANYLPTFFGEFTDFLNDTLIYFPEGFFDVIKLGFLACIIVMIIKVL